MIDGLKGWYRSAVEAWKPLMGAESRFSALIGQGNDVAGLAACDELSAAAEDACLWLLANPCPDKAMEQRWSGQIDCYLEVAELLRVSITKSTSMSEDEVVARVVELHSALQRHGEALGDWEL